MSDPKEPRAMHVNAFFGDGDHRMSLHDGNGWDLLRELQEKTMAGPMELFRKLYSGNYGLDDIREILRLGLIGGGKSPSAAMALVRRYIDREPANEYAELALQVLSAGLFGVGATPAEDEPEAADED